MKISIKQYAKLVDDLTTDLSKEDAAVVVGKIVRVIKNNGDQRKINDITDEFSRMYDQRQGIVHATVITTRPLTPTLQRSICDLIAKRTGTIRAKVQLATEADPSIQGGMIVKIGNEVWDASIKRKIERLSLQLTH